MSRHILCCVAFGATFMTGVLALQSGCQQQPPKGLSDRFLIVDDGDERSGAAQVADHETLHSIVANVYPGHALDQGRIALGPRTP